MEEGESKKAALILMKNSHFDRTLRKLKVDLESQIHSRVPNFYLTFLTRIHHEVRGFTLICNFGLAGSELFEPADVFENINL